jgi:hypothetical protein
LRSLKEIQPDFVEKAKPRKEEEYWEIHIEMFRTSGHIDGVRYSSNFSL